jgi:hypothetical protein
MTMRAKTMAITTLPISNPKKMAEICSTHQTTSGTLTASPPAPAAATVGFSVLCRTMPGIGDSLQKIQAQILPIKKDADKRYSNSKTITWSSHLE